MNILVVCQYYYPEPFRISDICESLAKAGHQVTVLTGLPNYPKGIVLKEYRHGKKRDEMINGVHVKRTFLIGRGNGRLKLFLNYISFMFSAILKVWSMKDDYDVVMVNQLSPVLMGLPAMAYKWKHKKKILFYCLDLWPDSLAAGGISKQSIIYKMFYKISRWIYRSADEILVTSQMFKDYFRYDLKLKDLEIDYLPQYAEDLFYDVSNEARHDGFNLMFAGNIGEMQSVETIIRAANELKAHRDITFHIVGDGSNYTFCKNLSDNLKLENIVFHGRYPVDQMPKFYSESDAMLITMIDNPAISLTLPGKVQSYMAAGKPIIGAINGETQNVIRESKCGYCCAAEDYIGLADKILEFTQCTNKEELSKNAKQYYVDYFSKEHFMKVLISKLEKMVR